MAAVFMAAYTNYRRDPRVRREAEALVEAGHEVTFLACRQPGEPDHERIAGVELHKVAGAGHDRTSALGYLFGYGRYFLALAAHLARAPRRYDLIHVNNMPDFLVFAAWLPRLLGVPVIHDVHDLMPELYQEKFGVPASHWVVRAVRQQERWAGRFASAVLTVEARLRETLATRGMPADKIHVLMNLPDDRIFARRPPPPPRAPGAPFVLVYHGTLARRLGLDVAIEAVARLRPRIPEIELRIFGAGEERATLIALAAELGLGAHVTFSEGFVPVERVPALIAAADLGVIPLRRCAGTDVMLPTKLLEYVAVGIPCVVPRTPTVARYFDAGMVEFFAAEDVDSLAAAILRLHASPARRAALAECATERFGRRHAWSEHRKSYVQLVEALLAPRGRTSLQPTSEVEPSRRTGS
ncbi:MAG: glycosyltransferase family 4 protein [Steroidobacteraceae bacterium]|nr:glycosyltransferase family 4 protein [Steroidobacteraceae bacterium]